MGYKPGDMDTQWLSTLPLHDQSYLILFQDVVFRPAYDVSIKQQKISGQSVSELLDRPPMKDIIDNIANELEDARLKKSCATTSDDAIHDLLDAEDSDDKKRKHPELENKGLDEENEVLKPWVLLANERFHNYCEIFVDPGSSVGISQAIASSAMNCLRQAWSSR